MVVGCSSATGIRCAPVRLRRATNIDVTHACFVTTSARVRGPSFGQHRRRRRQRTQSMIGVLAHELMRRASIRVFSLFQCACERSATNICRVLYTHQMAGDLISYIYIYVLYTLERKHAIWVTNVNRPTRNRHGINIESNSSPLLHSRKKHTHHILI